MHCETPNQTKYLFINFPYDRHYKEMFNHLLFTVIYSGFIVRCPLEFVDNSKQRMDKIIEAISSSKISIHDISRSSSDEKTGLCRFNMPFELGLFLGCKEFGGGHHEDKLCLILDEEHHRYRDSISDLAGYDISIHEGDPEKLVREVRRFLLSLVECPADYPTESHILKLYGEFSEHLPIICERTNKAPDELRYHDWVNIIREWIIRIEKKYYKAAERVA